MKTSETNAGNSPCHGNSGVNICRKNTSRDMRTTAHRRVRADMRNGKCIDCRRWPRNGALFKSKQTRETHRHEQLVALHKYMFTCIYTQICTYIHKYIRTCISALLEGQMSLICLRYFNHANHPYPDARKLSHIAVYFNQDMSNSIYMHIYQQEYWLQTFLIPPSLYT